MAVFGRDSLITSFQAIPFAPELAASTLRTLALFQARQEDPFRDKEPGKILHELRLGEMTAFEERPHSPYYGAADSTMLFLIVLEEYVRWTGDRALARRARAGGARGGRLDRSLRRSRPRRLRRVRARRERDRPRQPVLEGLLGLDRLRRRHDRGHPARHLRAAGLRLRRQAPDGASGARGLERSRPGPSSWRSRPPSSSSGSTATSGFPSATSSRWRSTATSARSTRSPRTSATCSGAASPTRTRPRAASST